MVGKTKVAICSCGVIGTLTTLPTTLTYNGNWYLRPKTLNPKLQARASPSKGQGLGSKG